LWLADQIGFCQENSMANLLIFRWLGVSNKITEYVTHANSFNIIAFNGICNPTCVGIILFLTTRILSTLCRLSIWLCTGCNNGRYSYLRTSGRLWILDATISWRSHRVSCPRLDGVTLVDYRMLSSSSPQSVLFLAWPVYVSIMCF
jgi:hypothetical protein